jgi:RNA polymerase sigma-70 factor (ECF subfamily)
MGSAAFPPADALLAHAGFLRRLARSLLFDEGQAEDVVQETMLVALSERPRSGSLLRAWLAGIARNVALKGLRAEARRRGREIRAARPEACAAAGEVAARLELQRRVVEAVQALDEPYRSAVVHRWFEDRAPREIARATGVPVRTVETRLRRAVALLRGRLDAAHGGDRRAWCLGLALVVPVGDAVAASAAVSAASPAAVASTLAGAVMTKAAYLVTALLVLASFLAGWGLKPTDPKGAQRASRGDPAAAPDAPPDETARLRAELEKARAEKAALAEELAQARAAAAAAAAEGEGAAGEGKLEGPRFVFGQHDQVLSEIDWDAVGEALHEMPPLLSELLAALEKGEELPASLGDIQRWNGPLVKVALQIANAGVPGTGLNGSFTHPAVAANMVHAALAKSGRPLSEEQERALEELGRRYVAEETTRNAAYGEETLAFRKMVDEAALKDRLYSEVDALLTPEQRDLLHPEAIRGYSQVDLFSSGVLTYVHARPVPLADRATFVQQVTDRHIEELGLDAAARPVVEGLVREWANRVAKAGLDAPLDRNIPGMPLVMKNDRIRKAADLQLDLWNALATQLPLTDAQREKLRTETQIIVPHGP